MTAPEIGAEEGLEGLAGLPAVDPTARIGQVLAERYRIREVIGQGGMGVVYLAEHVVLEKPVALKVLNEELTTSRDAVNRFIYEAKAASRIGHENIVDVTDFGTTPDGGVFFVMERLDGEDLGHRVKRLGRLPWDRVCQICIQVCEALQAAHDKGIIHRDLKPENIFLIHHAGHDDFVKILDFGVAKFTAGDAGGVGKTKTGMIFGTPDYMAPEQAEGKSADPRVDIYALGIILYQLVTGDLPFHADTFVGVLHKHMTVTPDPPRSRVPDIPVALEEVILKAIAKKPEDRFGSMAELADALRAVLADAGGAGDAAAGPIEAQDVAEPSLEQSLAGALADSVESLGPDATAEVLHEPGGSAPVALPAAPARRLGPWVLAGLVLVLLGGGVSYLLLRPGGRGGQGGAPAGGPSVSDSPSAPRGVSHGAAGPAVVDGSARARPVAPVDAGGVADAAPRSRPVRPAVPPTIRLRVVTRPPGARVRIDGRVVGTTPLRGFTLRRDGQSHVLRLERRGYRSVEIPFVADANQDIDRTLRRGAGTTRLRPRPRTRPRPGRPGPAMRPEPVRRGATPPAVRRPPPRRLPARIPGLKGFDEGLREAMQAK